MGSEMCIRDSVLRTTQIAKLSFNHPSVVLTADVFNILIKSPCSSLERLFLVVAVGGTTSKDALLHEAGEKIQPCPVVVGSVLKF